MSLGEKTDNFWSRRRAAVAAEEAAQEAALEAAEAARAESELEEKSDEELLAERNLPDPDTLETPEQVRAFLGEALPQRLKTRALRRLWRLNPVLANLDGLLDYGEDFTDRAMVLENMQTAYQVGKGMLKHIEALAEAEAAKENGADQEAAEDLTDQVVSGDGDASVTALADHVPEEVEAPITPLPNETAYVADAEDAEWTPRPRRMTFTFEEQRT